jgi:hypothetical protein
MLQATVSGVPPYDGDYDLDLEHQFNGNELHLIKKVAGVRLGEIDEALRAKDYDLYVALAAIGIWRAGKVTKNNVHDLVELLMEAEGGKISFKDTDDEQGDETGPPAVAPSGPGSSGASNVSLLPSSEDLSSTGDDPPETNPLSTGMQP